MKNHTKKNHSKPTNPNQPLKIVFPEGNNEVIKAAAKRAEADGLCEAILLDGSDKALTEAMQMVKSGQADTIIAGIDYTSRDVILSARDRLGMKPGLKAFSSVFFMEMPPDKNGDRKIYALSDAATCKHPDAEQLADIIISTVESARAVLDDEPRVAVLSFSTFGSGGKDATIDIARAAIANVKKQAPDILIDGEMQLDAAINLKIGAKKAPDSPVAGRANVLICPDLNSGNILYKSMQQFAGATAIGPILQGFNRPVSDLSRGSTEGDIYGVIRTMTHLA
ncbi:phosphate acyltransferase [Candidatus Saccharibacteria bacterium]|nr:phosphate acyltransferase [Candidatus Saccharibacteria bacterium]